VTGRTKQADFSRFRTPQELNTFFEKLAENIAPSDFIRKPQYKLLKEAWCALRFGLGYENYVESCHVSINEVENSDTDFTLKTGAGSFPFQTTIADVPERRMGDDYKPGPDGNLPLRPYAPERGRIEGPKWIADVVREKAEKKYANSGELSLLVYANFSAHEMDYQEVCNQVKKHRSSFLSIWVITNHQICSLTTIPELGEILYFANLHESEAQ